MAFALSKIPSRLNSTQFFGNGGCWGQFLHVWFLEIHDGVEFTPNLGLESILQLDSPFLFEAGFNSYIYMLLLLQVAILIPHPLVNQLESVIFSGFFLLDIQDL